MKVQSRILAAMCAAGVVAGTAQAAIIHVTTNITADTTWQRWNEYILHDPIYVTGGATLNIQAGTLIRGTKSTGEGDKPGALIVSRDGTIMANGSATQPIVFTDMWDDHFVGQTPVAGTAPYNQPNNFIAGNWGGVIILGSTYLAHSDAEVQIEGLEPAGAMSTYGGTDDDDDSGDFTFVSIRHGGYVIGKSNEINGLTMGGVGRGTKIQHVEVYQTLDDAFEWFGGTVDTKYLAAWNFGDDGFDWDEGFRGRGQFWFGVKGLAYNTDGAGYDHSDHALEMDGANKGDQRMPQAIPTVYNMTFVGFGAESTNALSAGQMDLGWLFRDGTGGRFVNSMMLDFGGAVAMIEGSLTDGIGYDSADKTQQLYTRDGSYTHFVDGMMKLDIRNSVFWGVEYPDAKAATNGVTSGWFSGKAWGSDDDKDHLGAENGYSLLEGKGNVAIDRASEPLGPIFGIQRDVVATDGVFPVVFIDPTLLDGRYMGSSMQPPATQADVSRFYSPVAFKGAFGGKNWAAWTYAAKLGLMPDDNFGVYEDATGNGVVDMQIVRNGNLVSFTMDPSVHEGYVGDVCIGYYNAGWFYGYNHLTGVFEYNKVNATVMTLQKLNLQNILDVSSLPAGSVIHYIIDQTPDGRTSGLPRFGWKTLTL